MLSQPLNGATWSMRLGPTGTRGGFVDESLTLAGAARSGRTMTTRTMTRNDTSDSRLTGRWIDPCGAFFNGSAVEITEDSWGPVAPKMQVHATATYFLDMSSYRRAELFEKRADGTLRRYRATVGPNQTLVVEMPANQLQWTLVRDTGNIVPSGFFMWFERLEDEQRHAQAVDQRNRLKIWALASIALACASGEAVVSWSRVLSGRSGAVVALVVMCFTACSEFGLMHSSTSAILVALLCSLLVQAHVAAGREHACGEGADEQDGVALMLSALLSFVTHCFLEVRSFQSWVVPASQVLGFVCVALLDYRACTDCIAELAGRLASALLLGLLGLAFWTRRWLDEKAERGAWIRHQHGEKRAAEQARAESRIRDVMEVQNLLQEFAFSPTSSRPLQSLHYVRSTTSEFTLFAQKSDAVRPQQTDPTSFATFRTRELDAREKTVATSTSKTGLHPGYFRHTNRRWSWASFVNTMPSLPSVSRVSSSLSSEPDGRLPSESKSPPFLEERPRKAPVPDWLPTELGPVDLAQGEPNGLLSAALANAESHPDLIRDIAEKIRLPSYSLKSFFEDCLQAFPELQLFFVCGGASPSSSGDAPQEEYQRTIGALFSVYWLLRINDPGAHGREGFCFGVDSSWSTPSGASRAPSLEVATSKCASEMTEAEKRQVFFHNMDWEKFSEVVEDSLIHSSSTEVERIMAMLALTAFHDIMKVQDLCPTVQEAHAPYQGFGAGSVILDHDKALAYVLEHFGDLLPSYRALPADARAVVLLTQAKMQFNHGWFVQAEAPPGAMLSGFRRIVGSAPAGDIAFYFFHWLTDLAGADGTPMSGSVKFVVNFPLAVLKEFLWSMPFLQRLQDHTETDVVEHYLIARWRATLPNQAIPTGNSSVALMRLAAMAGSNAETAVEMFRTLTSRDREVLSREMALTGLEDQRYRCCAIEGGAPALLVYYGPALLQRCQAWENEMKQALVVLAAVYRAGRRLWPFQAFEAARADMKTKTVTLEIGQLKSLSVSRVFNAGPEEIRRVWILLQRNEQEAVAELKSSSQINALLKDKSRFAFLDLDEKGEGKEDDDDLSEDMEQDEGDNASYPLGDSATSSFGQPCTVDSCCASRSQSRKASIENLSTMRASAPPPPLLPPPAPPEPPSPPG